DNSEEKQQASTNGSVRVNKENSFKEPTIIHLIDGEKGGCGKSFFSRTFIEYCNSIAYDIAIVDADISNKDIATIYPSVEVAYFSDDEKLAFQADKIFDLAFEKSVLVNLPAQVYSNVTDWIQRNDLVNLGKDNSIKFIKWFVCMGGVDSVNFFLQSLNDFGNDIVHVFVRNQGLCDEWDYINEMPEFKTAISDHNFIIMDFPKFPFWERNMIDRLGTTFDMAIAHPDIKVIPKQRIKNFLKVAYASLAATELIQ
ncbi:MAG: cobalamin biosynthesis protein CobQ, partial [Cyanobacteria bacterium J06633_8]